MLFLDKQVTLMMMDYDNDGNSLQELNKRAKKALTAAFGGVTIVDGTGTWLQGSKLYQDKNKLYQCNYSGNLTEEQKQALLRVIQAEFTQGKQEAVSVMYGHKLAIIDQNDVKNSVLARI